MVKNVEVIIPTDVDTVEQKTHTKWSALTSANLVPTQIVCNGYRPFHTVDSGCHTRLKLDPEQLKAHVEGGHGGGFSFKFRKGDKPWAGWKKFELLNLEAMDFRCEICNAVIPFHPMHILKHMRPHTGNQRRVLPGGLYNMTLNVGIPTATEEEAFVDSE
jgi:hypothetical protein